MEYVYIDESGDIGSKSKHIVFAAIITKNDRSLEKLVKKIWHAKPQYHKKGRLHAVEVDDSTRIRMLKSIVAHDVKIKISHYKKGGGITNQTKQYYIELAKFITLCGATNVVVVERKDTIKLRTYVINNLGLNGSYKHVIFGDPHVYKHLQATDFVAWAYGRLLEQDDSTYSDIIGADFEK